MSYLLLTTTDRPSSSRGLNVYLGVDSHGAVPEPGLSVPHRDTSFGLGSPHVLRAFKRRYEYNHLRNLRSSQQKKNPSSDATLGALVFLCSFARDMFFC